MWRKKRIIMKQSRQELIQEMLSREHPCYVLITCDTPSGDGNMNVEMCYEGDPTLASYLIHGAQSIIDQQSEGDDESRLRLIE